MDIELGLTSSLITCPECNIIFQYYDFLSHSELCYNRNESIEIEIDIDIPISSHSHRYSYNGLNNYGNYSYSNSGNSSNSDDAIYTLNNYLLSLSLNTSSTNTNSYCGLNKTELEKNSNIIECNDSTDCPICLCNYPQHTYFYSMNCNHSFCIDCCEKWFSKNSLCPLCRKNYK